MGTLHVTHCVSYSQQPRTPTASLQALHPATPSPGRSHSTPQNLTCKFISYPRCWGHRLQFMIREADFKKKLMLIKGETCDRRGISQGFRINMHTLSCCMRAQSCPTLCNPMDCSPPGSSVHGILQARTLEWVAMPSSRGSF